MQQGGSHAVAVLACCVTEASLCSVTGPSCGRVEDAMWVLVPSLTATSCPVSRAYRMTSGKASARPRLQFLPSKVRRLALLRESLASLTVELHTGYRAHCRLNPAEPIGVRPGAVTPTSFLAILIV